MTRPGPREAAAGARVAGDCAPEALRPDNVARFVDAEVISPFVHLDFGAAVLAGMPRLPLSRSGRRPGKISRSTASVGKPAGRPPVYRRFLCD